MESELGSITGPPLPDGRYREVALAVGDEAGDAMMLEFEDPKSVANRGSLLGADIGVGERLGSHGTAWVRGRYRKDDWLVYRRHAVRTLIAPVEKGRENVGADEAFDFTGGVRWAPRAGCGVESNVAAGHFPGLWIRDRMTRRDTKWRGESAAASVRSVADVGAQRIEAELGFQGARAECIHLEPSRDVRFESGTVSGRLSSCAQLIPDRLGVRLILTGLRENEEVIALGDDPSHGYDGPPSRGMWGVSVEPSAGFGSRSMCLSVGAEKWDDRPLAPGFGVRWRWRLTDETALKLAARQSRRVPDLFQEHGWSRVIHPDAPAEGIRFTGGDLDPEVLEHVEMAFEYDGKRETCSRDLGRTSSIALAVYRERVRDLIAAAGEQWFRLGSDLEWVRSGRWTNAGTVTSTGADLSLGTEARRGALRAYVYVRDVEWKAGKPDVTRPTLGGRWGAGMLTRLHLPKRTDVLVRLRSADPPRFTSYGGWTEGMGTDRLRWDAALEAQLGNRWHATITALDILDSGHIEIPGGNAVGFRVAGEARYRW